MLLSGINHVAVLTQDTERFHAFYGEVFGATVFAEETVSEGRRQAACRSCHAPARSSTCRAPGPARTTLRCSASPGRSTTSASRPSAQEAFDEIRRRLIERGATDGFVTDFGVAISLFFIDPDGLEGEVVLDTPGTGPADMKPPGTPAAGYERVTDS